MTTTYLKPNLLKTYFAHLLLSLACFYSILLLLMPILANNSQTHIIIVFYSYCSVVTARYILLLLMPLPTNYSQIYFAIVTKGRFGAFMLLITGQTFIYLPSTQIIK